MVFTRGNKIGNREIKQTVSKTNFYENLSKAKDIIEQLDYFAEAVSESQLKYDLSNQVIQMMIDTKDLGNAEIKLKERIFTCIKNNDLKRLGSCISWFGNGL